MPQCRRVAGRNIAEIKLLLHHPAAAATLAWSTKRMECIRTRRSRNSWWRERVSRRRTACCAPEETLKAYLAAHNPSRQTHRLKERRAGTERRKLLYPGSLQESALSVRHLGRSMHGLRAGTSAAPLMTAARVAAGDTSLTCRLPTSGEPPLTTAVEPSRSSRLMPLL